LPDIKVVRTAFFVNGAAIVIALSATLYFGLKEWQLRGLQGQTAVLQSRIDRDKKASDQAVALFKKFQTEEAKVVEVDAFVQSKPIVSALIMRLGETLPPNIAIDSIDLRDNGLVLRMSVRGDAAAASGYASAYLDQLKADKQLTNFEDVVFTSTPTRNPATNRMAVEFLLKTRGPASAPVGGKK